MEPVSEALRLLKRQADIEQQLRQPGGISILAERELFAIRDQLRNFPASVRAITELLGASRKPLEQIRTEDVERWDPRG